MKEKERKFDLDDISIIPSIVSEINSRSECKTGVPGALASLPLMAAPMDTVVCPENLDRYLEEGIMACMPREQRAISHNPQLGHFQAFGLAEIEMELYIENGKNPEAFYNFPAVLIDIANGHMEKLIQIVKDIKERYPTIRLMVGNVAHPLTYKNLALAGADFIRVGIGVGFGCTTAANVAINYPMGSLISECRKIKEEFDLSAKIVADGGTRNYSDIIKSLALGCFLPNMIVYTPKGFKRIKNIIKNDYVLTHTFKKQKVNDIFIYENDKDIIQINDIYTTSNHHFYVVHKKYKNTVNEKNIYEYAEWVEAKDLNEDYLLIQIDNIKIWHQMQRISLKIFSKIYIIYLKITGKLNEKKKS